MVEKALKKKIVLTGVTPSGDSLHLGNYFGMMKPLVELAANPEHEVYCFLADLHALTTIKDPEVLRHNIKNVILNYLACGVDDLEKFVFFRQSQVSEHSELMVILGNYVGLGQMRRMHAFKDKLQKGEDEGAINMGLFNYPILMAADILLYDADLVPVGVDQKQHVEIARDIAENLNRSVGDEGVLCLPEPLISAATGKIVGTDGERKMSKSLGNVVGIFDDYSVIEKQIMSSYTDSTRLKATDPGHVEGNPIFVYHDLINENVAEVAELKARYEAGTVGDVEVKRSLVEAHKRYFGVARARKEKYEAETEEVARILEAGREKATARARQTLTRVQKAVGL